MLIKYFKNLSQILFYFAYDHFLHFYYKKKIDFNGWGIHLFVGSFGSGKTCYMVNKAYELCLKYPQLSVLTNIKLVNFPKWTNIIPLNSANDILNAPSNTLVLIDEIGTIFNSRDFNSGKCAVPKPLFQHLCQCRKRKIMIYGTVQRFNLLDKQIRDIAADVTSCHSHFKYPFSRFISARSFDIDEYELYTTNRTYTPSMLCSDLIFISNRLRNSYDTSELVTNMLNKEYISDAEILSNRDINSNDVNVLDRKQNRSLKRRKVW